MLAGIGVCSWEQTCPSRIYLRVEPLIDTIYRSLPSCKVTRKVEWPTLLRVPLARRRTGFGSSTYGLVLRWSHR